MQSFPQLAPLRKASEPHESMRMTETVHLRSKWRRSRTALETSGLLGQLQLAHVAACSHTKGRKGGQAPGSCMAARWLTGLTA